MWNSYFSDLLMPRKKDIVMILLGLLTTLLIGTQYSYIGDRRDINPKYKTTKSLFIFINLNIHLFPLLP